MSSLEDKCEVSEDNHEDQKNNGKFLRSDKLGRGQKRKEQTASWRIYKDVEVGGTRRQFFLLLKLSTLRNFKHYSRYVMFLLFYYFNRTTFGLIFERVCKQPFIRFSPKSNQNLFRVFFIFYY